MAKSKTLKYKNKNIVYKTIPQLAKIIKKSKNQTRLIVKLNKKLNTIAKKKIQFKGKVVSFKDKKELGKKLKLDLSETTQLLGDIKSKKTERYLEINGNIGKYDITDKPLIFQDFNIKRLSNKQFISNKSKTNKIKIVNKLSISKKLNTYVVVQFYVPYWDNKTNSVGGMGLDDGIRTTQTVSFERFNPNFNESSSELNAKIAKRIREEYFYENTPPPMMDKRNPNENDKRAIFIDNIRYYNKQGGQQFKMKNMVLREQKPLKISHIFNEIIPNDNSENCVYNHLSKIWKKKVKPEILHLLHTTEDIYNFCVGRNIKMIAYDITRTIIKAYYPKTKSNYKSCIFIAYNNHLYPLKNAILTKVIITDIEDIPVDNVYSRFMNYLRSGVLPTNILINQDTIIMFSVDKKRYFQNPDYSECKKILKSFGLLDQLRPFTTLKNISNTLEKLYVKSGINSFMPKANRFIKAGILYKKEECEVVDDFITIDKNKAYSSSLMNLKRLIKTDIRVNKTYSINNTKDIIDHHLYIVEVEKSSILLPHNSIYTGEYLKYCIKQKLKFKIIEGLETQQEPNYLKNMIKDIYDKVPSHQAKFICNVMIGKFAQTCEISQNLKCLKLANQTESKLSDGVIIPCNKNYNFICEEKTSYNIYNRKPIHIQILDNARKILYEQMLFLKLKPDDIIQIKTDSITFKNPKSELMTKKLKKIIFDGIEGWKYEKYNAMGCPAVHNKYIGGFGYDEFFTNDNLLCECYAGAGKTYDILNEIVPKVKNYIVLTPSHASLKEYRIKNINCSVIQRYTLKKIIPTEHIIIIDEIGMIDKVGCDLIYKCILEGKQIIAYGDFQQLRPVRGNVNNSNLWLDLAFSRRKKLTTNFRNNFSKEYYDSLIKSKNIKYLTKEIKKWAIDYKKADVIICYRNTTREYYNALKCRHLNISYKLDKEVRQYGQIVDYKISFDLRKLKIGTKIISNTNELSKNGIYNKFTFTITDIKKDKITLDDNIIINKELLNKVVKNKSLFSFAYARTLYSVQGASLNSFAYPDIDMFFLNGRSAYTAISRLRQKKY
tara:strand:+ start:598 stop:3768 length:3171 start_codon:yes stop_codon:yes gene_type:complete